jgi:metal-responsive CopG/Arc/MetJ family transcriptional regulator
MATTEVQLPSITVPATLLEEVKELARSQERPVNDVLVEAIDRYVHEQEWERLMTFGQARAKKLGYTEDDVERLIAEVRQEYGDGER